MASPAAVLAINVRANTARAQASLGKMDAQLRKSAASADKFERSTNRASGGAGGLTNKMLGLKLAVGAVSFAPAVKGANALAASAVSMASALGPLSGLLGTIPGAAVGMGTALGSVSLAMGDLKQAVGGLNEDLDTSSAAFKRLSPEGQRFARTLQGMKPQIQGLQSTAQQGLFPGLESGLRGAMKNLPVFNRMIGQTSATLGMLADVAGRQLGGEAWGRDLGLIAQSNAKALQNLGFAGIAVGNALRHVAVAARPLNEWLSRLALKWAVYLNAQAAAGRESGRMAAFFERTRRITERLISIIGHLGSGLRAVFSAGTRDGDSLWRSVDRVAARFDRWANSLSGQQALRQWFRNGRTDLENFFRSASQRFHQLRAEGKSTGQAIAGVISDIIFKAITYSAEQMATHAPKIAEAFIRGFLNAPILGQLLVGGWLLAKFGGIGAFSSLGSRSGGGFGKAFGIAAVAAIGFPALRKKIMDLQNPTTGGMKLPTSGGILGQGARSFGGLATDGTVPKALKGLISGGPKKALAELNKSFDGERIRKWGNDANAAFIKFRNAGNAAGMNRIAEQARRLGQQMGGTMGAQLIKAANNMQRLTRPISRVNTAIASLRGAVHTNVGAMTRHINQNFNLIERTLGSHTRDGRLAVTRNFRAMASSVAANIKSGQITTREGMRAMAASMRVHSKGGAQATMKNFRATAAEIQRQVNKGALTTKQGMQLIHSLMNQTLKQLGAARAKPLRLDSKAVKQLQGRQRGGHINEGKASGDSVPAMLEKGEYVLNRNAVKKTGVPQLNALNYGAAPRFQTGGPVGHAMGGLAGVHAGAASVARWAGRHYGATVTSGKRNGGGGSHHDRGNAADLVSGNMVAMAKGIWRNFGHKLEELIHTPLGWSVDHGRKVAPYAQADHYDHVHEAVLSGKALVGGGGSTKIPRILVGGPGTGQIGGVSQAAVDKVRDAANKKIEAAEAAQSASDSSDVSGLGKGINGANRSMGKQMAERFRSGWGRGPQWRALDHLWGVDEGSWNENLANMAGSGAYGIAQALPASKYPPAGRPSAPPGPTKAKAQIGWGLNYIAGRYGTPIGADSARHAKGWYQKGGLVQALQTGGAAAGGRGGARGRTPLTGQVAATAKLFGAKGKKGSAKARSKNLGRLLKNIKGWGLKPSTQNTIDTLTADSTRYGELADRAQQLTVEGGDGTKAVKGMVNGLDEGGWLTKQLTALFFLRNKLAEAAQVLRERQQAQMQALADAKKRYDGLVKRIKGGDDHVRKFGKSKAAKTKVGKKILKGMKDTQTRRKRARGVLKDKIIPSLTEQRDLAGEKRSEIGEALNQVQGAGGPMGKLSQLPAVGTLGGDIFNTQIRLRDLGAKTTGVTDNSSERADLLAQTSREWQQRFNVSQAQYGVLKDLPFGGSFATGGVVPGPSGAARQAVVHGGEGIFRKDQLEAMGGSGDVQVIVHGDILSDRRDPVEVVLGDQRFKAAVKNVRVPNRSLPGSR